MRKIDIIEFQSAELLSDKTIDLVTKRGNYLCRLEEEEESLAGFVVSDDEGGFIALQDLQENDNIITCKTAFIDVGFNVWIVDNHDHEPIQIFAMPRPSPFRLSRESPRVDRILLIVREAISSNAGIILAGTAESFIGDARLVPHERALRLLGFIPRKEDRND